MTQLKIVNSFFYVWIKALICLILANFFLSIYSNDLFVANEVPDCIPLYSTTKGTDIFEEIKEVVSDRTMIGTDILFAVLLKQIKLKFFNFQINVMKVVAKII